MFGFVGYHVLASRSSVARFTSQLPALPVLSTAGRYLRSVLASARFEIRHWNARVAVRVFVFPDFLLVTKDSNVDSTKARRLALLHLSQMRRCLPDGSRLLHHSHRRRFTKYCTRSRYNQTLLMNSGDAWHAYRSASLLGANLLCPAGGAGAGHLFYCIRHCRSDDTTWQFQS